MTSRSASMSIRPDAAPGPLRTVRMMPPLAITAFSPVGRGKLSAWYGADVRRRIIRDRGDPGRAFGSGGGPGTGAPTPETTRVGSGVPAAVRGGAAEGGAPAEFGPGGAGVTAAASCTPPGGAPAV